MEMFLHFAFISVNVHKAMQQTIIIKLDRVCTCHWIFGWTGFQRLGVSQSVSSGKPQDNVMNKKHLSDLYLQW